MPLVPAKCTQCGGDLQIDNTKEAAVCPYCGSAFIVEKAIQLYNQTYNISANTVNVYKQENDRDTADTLYETGSNALNAGNIQLAERCFDDIKKFYPSDYRGPWGKMKCYSVYNFKDAFEQEYADVCVLANSEQKSIITNEYNQFMEKHKRELEKFQAEIDAKIDDRIKEDILNAKISLKEKKLDLYSFIITEAVLCAIFICSLIFNFNTLIQIFSGLFFFSGMCMAIGVLPELLSNFIGAKHHYQYCKSDKHRSECERDYIQ
jgi:predicted RNA-binding Zn-ribbon protein involved in translation (DUF1610 family)